MKFRLEIKLGNEAMRDFADISQALIGMARKFDMRHNADVEIGQWDTSALRDSNGNIVGQWEIVE